MLEKHCSSWLMPGLGLQTALTELKENYEPGETKDGLSALSGVTVRWGSGDVDVANNVRGTETKQNPRLVCPAQWQGDFSGRY